MILVSSCLAGLNVRYNGTNCLNDKIRKLVEENKAITICPELLGGFSTPREPAEIIGGNANVVEKSGKDVTQLYIKGAYSKLKQAIKLNANLVVLKENSPSCGSLTIYNGELTGKKIMGRGVTSALLIRNGIKVISEELFAATFL